MAGRGGATPGLGPMQRPGRALEAFGHIYKSVKIGLGLNSLAGRAGPRAYIVCQMYIAYGFALIHLKCIRYNQLISKFS